MYFCITKFTFKLQKMDTNKLLSKLKRFFTLRLLTGLVLGGVAGFMYYYFVGCNSGSCAITSSPVNSTLYGMLFGGVLLYKEEKKVDKAENTDNNTAQQV